MSKMMTSIRTSSTTSGEPKLEIVNQLLLPHTTEWIEINSVDEAYDAIKSMKIRGAPAIASLAALSIASHLSRALSRTPPPEFLSSSSALRVHLRPLLDHLLTSRPTAVNLGVAIKRLTKTLEAGGDDKPVSELVLQLIKEANAINDEDVGRNWQMSRLGAEWLLEQTKGKVEGGKLNMMTVCNTGSLATSGYGTALGLITYLFETKSLKKAYYTQSAPYHQGSRLTSLELKTLGIPSVMICDTMVGSLFQNVEIHAVVVGADRVARNGDTANKVGTYNAAVLAARHRIPFIVVAPVSTIDLDIPDGSHIPIEHRPPLEACLARGALYPPTPNKDQAIVQITPDLDLAEGVYNPSFDVTPAKLITAVVTEKGVAVKREGEGGFDLSGVV